MDYKVPRNYFKPVTSGLALMGLSIVWLGLPILGFCSPAIHMLASAGLVPFLLESMPLFRSAFYMVVVAHLFELQYAMYLCGRYGLSPAATIKWYLSVFFNGGFALIKLHRPEIATGHKSGRGH